ncbi:MAG: glutathione S-transferase C-terminal domain-containing protein, partial [Rhodanobacter sp.]
MLRLDSTLGLHARRLGYTQVIMECPNILSQLFLPDLCGGLFTRRGWRALAAPVLGTMLSLRFRFHRNREDGVYEALEAQLIPIAVQLERDGFLVGGRFSAADITLASLLRPLRIVPHFVQHPRLRSL